MKSRKPKVGKILITLRGKFNVYTVITKERHEHKLMEEDMIHALRNLSAVLSNDEVITIRISRYGDITAELESKWLEKLVEIFQQDSAVLNLCYGKTEVPAEEYKTKIIAKYHDNIIAGNKGVGKTYIRIREKFTCTGLRQ